MILCLIQMASVFSVLYLLYILFLNTLTFHNVNRLVLLLLPIVSIIIPFSEYLFPTLSSNIIEIPLFEKVTFDTIHKQLQTIEQPLREASFNYSVLLVFIYWLVFTIYFIRIIFHIRQLFILRKKSIIQQKKGYQLVAANVSDIFSYFNWIFIPKHKIEQYNPEIIEHEKVHIQLKHSWDVIFSEIYIAFFWFNPLTYFYRKSLKSVHEFQADNRVLQNGARTSKYIQLLLQGVEIHQKTNNFYNYFNQSILKKRVIMMTKPKSNHMLKITYILLLPVCTFLTSAFTSPMVDSSVYLDILEDSTIISKPISLFPVQKETVENITTFFGVMGKHSNKKNVVHGGIDIRGKSGTPILATADGIVNKAAMVGDWGNLIIITHADGYETWYAHLKGFNIIENQSVKKGDIIGYLGNSGKSKESHLHYEIKYNGKRLNPINYLK